MLPSTDVLHPVRVAQALAKASHIRVQLAEYNAHKQLVDEYKLDMYAHLLQLEAKTRPNLPLIQQQPEINLRMRPVLLDFLMDVINKLGLLKLTFPLTVNIIDRYCLVRIVKKQHYQLLGLTALWIASKNLDAKFRIPLLNDLCKYCCHCYDRELFLEMENHVLKSFVWLVDAPTFDSFVDVYIHLLTLSRFLAGSKSPHKTCNNIKVLALYICELVQFYPNIYFNYTLPKIAIISVVLACMILDLCKPTKLLDMLSFLAQDTCTTVIGVAEFDAVFALLTKVLKCPPPSLKAKYFAENLRFVPLMKLLVSFTWKHLAKREARRDMMCTPANSGGATPKYPVTPVSQSSSLPDGYVHAEAIADTFRALPLPNLLPAEEYAGKRKHDADDTLAMDKRPKTVCHNAVFYIH